jgi:hypothetical protein
VLGWLYFAGPKGIRTLDLFHAMEVELNNLRRRKQAWLARLLGRLAFDAAQHFEYNCFTLYAFETLLFEVSRVWRFARPSVDW